MELKTAQIARYMSAQEMDWDITMKYKISMRTQLSWFILIYYYEAITWVFFLSIVGREGGMLDDWSILLLHPFLTLSVLKSDPNPDYVY